MISRCQRGLLRNPRGSLACLVAGLLAGHLHVTAEENRREAEIRLPSLEPEQARAEAEAEGLHPDIKESRRPVMPKFVE